MGRLCSALRVSGHLPLLLEHVPVLSAPGLEPGTLRFSAHSSICEGKIIQNEFSRTHFSMTASFTGPLLGRPRRGACPVAHKHSPGVTEAAAACVLGCSPLCILPDRAAPRSLPPLSILLSHWSNRGMWPLQRYSKHANTLPPAGPTTLMDTCSRRCRALIFQLPHPIPPFSLHNPRLSFFSLLSSSGSTKVGFQLLLKLTRKGQTAA